jgi:FKBP-type peptidyl-prolyl cis-trans isomerase
MSKKIALGLLAALVLAPAGCAQPAGKAAETKDAKAADKPAASAASPAAPGGLATDDEKSLYTVGLIIARQLGPLGVDEKDLPIVIQGLTDGTLKKEPKLKLEEWGPKVQEFAKARATKAAEAEKKVSAAYLEKAGAEAGAVKKPSGLVYFSVKEGTGASPKPTDKVKVHYHGTLTDGTVFDSSVQRGQPASFPLNGVIPCWTEGVGMMKVGGKAKLVCPSTIAYGDQGQGPIKPGATLVFEVELLEIEKPTAAAAPSAPAAPAAPAAPKK